MAVEMNEKEYEVFASELLENIQDDIKLMYLNNNNPSTLGAISVNVDDDTKSYSITYIGEGTELFNSLTYYQKEEIENISDDEIFVMIVWKGMFAYFQIIQEEESFLDLSTELIPDNEEEEEKVLTYFLYHYLDGKEGLMIDESIIDENDSYIEVCSKVMLNEIESGNESPESLMTSVYFNLYKLFLKIDYVDNKALVKPENMLQNFNEVEKSNFSFIGGTILFQIYKIVDSSSLKDNEKIDFRLDIDNFVTIANSVEKLEFDKNTKSFDHLIGMANEIRNQANK